MSDQPQAVELSADDPRLLLAEHLLSEANKFCDTHIPGYEARFQITLSRKKPAKIEPSTTHCGESDCAPCNHANFP